jgi:hypothetical protein
VEAIKTGEVRRVTRAVRKTRNGEIQLDEQLANPPALSIRAVEIVRQIDYTRIPG